MTKLPDKAREQFHVCPAFQIPVLASTMTAAVSDSQQSGLSLESIASTLSKRGHPTDKNVIEKS